jgi:hypothetical protein
MADEIVTPPVAPAATDPAPAPSDATPPAATTLLTQGETPPADPAAKPATPPAEPPKAAPVVPEKYDFATVKLPEGVKLEGAIVDAVSPVFKELGLSQEQAAKLVSTHAEAMHKHAIEAEKAAETAFQKEMSDRATANIAAIKTEWGNDFDANLKIAQRGLARLFPGTEGKSLLDQTGLGNHPEFLKAFLAAGRMFQEDKPPNGTLPSGARKSDAEVFYGSSAN